MVEVAFPETAPEKTNSEEDSFLYSNKFEK